MRCDYMFWALIAPALLSCACCAFEMPGNFAESWNIRFEELRRGFEMLGGKARPTDIHLSLQQVPATSYAERVVLVAEQKRRR